MAEKTKTKKVELPEWKSAEATKLMEKRTRAFLAKHGTSEAVTDLQELLTLSTKLTGYRNPCQAIRTYTPPEPEPEDEDEEEGDEEVVDDEEEDE